MHRRNGRIFTRGLVLAGFMALGGCSTAGLVGQSSWGSNQLAVAEVAGIADYTAPGALKEARARFRNGDFGHSAAFYKRAVELSPKDPEGYVGLGASYDRLRRFDLADRVYAALFELSGGTAQYYNNLGYSHMLRGNLAQALGHFRKASAIDPGNTVIRNNIRLLSDAAAQSRA